MGLWVSGKTHHSLALHLDFKAWLIVLDVRIAARPAPCRANHADNGPPFITLYITAPTSHAVRWNHWPAYAKVSMITHSLYHILFLALAYPVVNVFSLPSPFRPNNVQSLGREDMLRWPPDPAHLEKRAAAPMDAPTGAPAGQSMYNEKAMNSTTTQPGVIPNLSLSREQVNCSDLSTGRDNKCWNELNLTSWVENWIIYNPCYENEGFSSCFLRKVGYPQLDCTGVKLATCTPPPVISSNDTRIFYVAYNIYGMYRSSERVDPLANIRIYSD